MSILVVGNVIKDVYLNLDPRFENFEIDRHKTPWLNLSFNASEHKFFHRTSTFGGAAISLEVLEKFGLDAEISASSLSFDLAEGFSAPEPPSDHRYILVSDEKVSYFAPSKPAKTIFNPPTTPPDFLYIDRSASLSPETVQSISSYLDQNPHTKLVLFIKYLDLYPASPLIPRAELLFLEDNREKPELFSALLSYHLDPRKIVFLSDKRLSYLGISEKLSPRRVDLSTHLSIFNLAATTILSSFILGKTVEESLRLAKLNVENSRLDASLTLSDLENLAKNVENPANNLELIAKSLVFRGKGILAADESGGSIAKKFAQLNIPDTYENRRDYRNIFFTTPDLEKHVNGVILFDETARQFADDGRNFVDFLISRRIIPGIKVDQGLEKFGDSFPPDYQPNNAPTLPDETWTKGLDGLDTRLTEYYQMGLRFAKWRAAFEIHLENGEPKTPTFAAILKNCQILAAYAKSCQTAGLVPIVEPEVVYDGNYSVETNAKVTAQILDCLFKELVSAHVNLRACILKVNMVLAGKQFETQSTPEEVGAKTAEVLKNHVPEDLAGVVFLSGGQSVEQATENLAAVEKNGPFPWPVTFSFARALQDPALYAWRGDNQNADTARSAFLARLVANTDALLS